MIIHKSIPNYNRTTQELNLVGIEKHCENNVINNCGKFYIANNLIYFVNTVDSKRLYTMDFRGKNLKRVSNEKGISYFIIDTNWIYFIKYDGLYKIKLDGTSLSKINHEQLLTLSINNGWVYYSALLPKDKSNASGEMYINIFKSKMDGTGKAKISEDKITDFKIIDDTIYYTLSNEPYIEFDIYEQKEEATSSIYKLYKMNLNGTNKEFITDVSNGYIKDYKSILLYTKETGYYSLETVGYPREEKIMDTIPTSLCVNNGLIYYLEDKHTISSINLKTKERKTITKESGHIVDLNVIGDWIIYENYKKSFTKEYKWYVKVVGTDGNNKQNFMSY